MRDMPRADRNRPVDAGLVQGAKRLTKLGHPHKVGARGVRKKGRGDLASEEVGEYVSIIAAATMNNSCEEDTLL